MYGWDNLCGISKGTFEIPHKMNYPYVETCVFYSQVKIEELLVRAHECFWNAPHMASSGLFFTKEVNLRFAKCPLVFNGRLKLIAG